MVWHLLFRLRRDLGMTLFLTTHLMDEADVLANRIAILAGGKAMAVGTPAELKASLNKAGATLSPRTNS